MGPEDNFTADEMARLAAEAPAKWAFVEREIFKHASLGHTQCVLGVDEVGPHHTKLELRGFRLTPHGDNGNYYVVQWPAKPTLTLT